MAHCVPWDSISSFLKVTLFQHLTAVTSSSLLQSMTVLAILLRQGKNSLGINLPWPSDFSPQSQGDFTTMICLVVIQCHLQKSFKYSLCTFYFLVVQFWHPAGLFFFETFSSFFMISAETTQGRGGHFARLFYRRYKVYWTSQAMSSTQQPPEDSTASKEKE